MVPLAHEGGSVRVIAGEYEGRRGPARTFTPMDVWDLRLKAGTSLQLPVAQGRTAALVVLRGMLRANGEREAGPASLVLFERDGEHVVIEAQQDSSVLLLSGEPIDEPIVGYGPFVMNSQVEIAESFDDFHAGRFGQMAEDRDGAAH